MSERGYMADSYCPQVYLITYARAYAQLCAGRREFADLVIDAFDSNKEAPKLKHWVVCKEPHEGGGHHYHMQCG